jgi:hypothetical protein
VDARVPSERGPGVRGREWPARPAWARRRAKRGGAEWRGVRAAGSVVGAGRRAERNGAEQERGSSEPKPRPASGVLDDERRAVGRARERRGGGVPGLQRASLSWGALEAPDDPAVSEGGHLRGAVLRDKPAASTRRGGRTGAKRARIHGAGCGDCRTSDEELAAGVTEGDERARSPAGSARRHLRGAIHQVKPSQAVSVHELASRKAHAVMAWSGRASSQKMPFQRA